MFKAHGAGPDDPDIVSKIAGCYQLNLGRWWPWGLGEDAQFVTPPSRIQLLNKIGKEGWEKDHLILRPLPNAGGRGGPSFWDIESNQHVLMVWTDGFTGMTIEAKPDANGFSGWVHPHFDMFHLIKHVAHMNMHKIDCD